MDESPEQWPRLHLMDVERYYRMAEVLAPDARVELIEGMIIDMAPIGSNHAGVVAFLIEALDQRVLRGNAILTAQHPVRLSNRSEPQPDVMLLRPRDDRYRKGHPTAADVLLLIEVSDSTLRFDLGKKAALYARHGIREVWVIDLPNQQLHQLRQPSGGRYGSVTLLAPPARVTVTALPHIELELAALLE